MENQSESKRNTIACPMCGRETSFNMLSDAIDEMGEFYRCRDVSVNCFQRYRRGL